MNSKKLIIEIDNLTEEQELAIKELLYNWEYSGIIGGSYWTAFFADGDSNFKPKIKVNGKKINSNKIAKECGIIRQPIILSNKDFAIDYDCLAWKLSEYNETKDLEKMEKVDYPIVSESENYI
jgi:hypothetical protein